MHTFELPESDRRKSHFQTRARDWRRETFKRLSAERDSRCVIATAHHADDQVETFLHKLLRGVSLSHLQPVRCPSLPRLSSHEHQMLPSSANYIRPLLRVQKQELVTYLHSKGLSWMEDASNSSRDYTRNKIRHDAVPPLSTIAGGNDALYR
jgi:tRNA(Ile)-lysidine synthase